MKGAQLEKILLITSSNNFADEFDVYGFALVTEDIWASHLSQVEMRVFPDNKCYDNYRDSYAPNMVEFGTNESILFETFQEYKNSFITKVITKEEADILTRLFGVKVNQDSRYFSGYGKFLCLYE